MCKKGWCVGLGQEGGCLRVGGGTTWNTLKGVEIEKRGGETKILKWGQAKSRDECLKKGEEGLEPLTNYVITNLNSSVYKWMSKTKMEAKWTKQKCFQLNMYLAKLDKVLSFLNKRKQIY